MDGGTASRACGRRSRCRHAGGMPGMMGQHGQRLNARHDVVKAG